MKYEVIAGIGSLHQTIGVKTSMDDALDLIQTMEEFDQAEGIQVTPDWYKVKIVKDFS